MCKPSLQADSPWHIWSQEVGRTRCLGLHHSLARLVSGKPAAEHAVSPAKLLLLCNLGASNLSLSCPLSCGFHGVSDLHTSWGPMNYERECDVLLSIKKRTADNTKHPHLHSLGTVIDPQSNEECIHALIPQIRM